MTPQTPRGVDHTLVERDLAADYFRAIPVTLGIHVVGAVLMLLPLAAGRAGLAWLAANVAVNAMRLVAARRALRRPPPAAISPRDVDLQAAGLFLDGLLWGCAPWLFFAGAPPLGQIYVFATVVVMAIGTTMINASFPRARTAFCAPALLLGGLRAVSEGGTQFHAIGAVLFISFPVVVFYGGHWARFLRESVRIRHENSALIAELRQQKAAADQAVVARTQFFAAASHDLRQPIHALGLFASALRDVEQGREGAALADRILDNIDALESLFDELLDIAKLDSGSIVASPSHFPLARLFARLTALHGLGAERAGVDLRFVPSPHHVLADPVLLERVLSNLVSNAVRFADGGAVLVGSRRRDGQVAIEVRDSGPGIAPGEHARIFEEFTQLGNPERDRRKGLGLGLATVQRLVRLMNARIEVRSREGQGSTFAVFVPRGDPRHVPDTPVPAAAPARDILADRHVLVIDDEETVRESMKSVLVRWACRCTLANSAEEALAALDGSPDVVVADYRLRDRRSGIEAIRAIREHHGASIPALLVTGDVRPEVFDAAAQAGLALLSKPVRAAQLRSVLAHLLATQEPDRPWPG